MSRGRQVTIQFIGDARSLVSATNASGKATNTLSSRFSKLGKTAAIGAGVAVVALAKGLWDVTEAAVADEVAAKKLALQLKNTTGATDAQVASVEDWITTQSKALGITDDELRPALSKLATATHDVTQAQDLLATAMDVSAGTGKSLDAVTSALQKGVNGSVGGLSRLGVKTKDAAGETKSFDSILADLNKNFNGQAAKAADTTAGKFERLKVSMSEAGEELGYKLLPYATEFGEYLLDEGIPAVEDLAHWVGDELGPVLGDLRDNIVKNKDEIRDFANGAGKQLVATLETVVDVGGQVIGVLDDLPGPVKDFAVQAAIVSRLMPGLTAGITGAGTATGGFVTNVRDAEKRTAALGKVAGRVGGLGGMLLLTQGVQESNDALSILEMTAGGALAGGAAGPWGALIGGGLGLAMGVFATQTGKASDSMEDAAPQAVNFANSLDQVTGAAKGSTRELILLDLQQQGALASAKALGISSKDLVGYMMGNEKAVRRVDKAMGSASGTTVTWTDQFGVQHSALTGSQADLLKLQSALGVTTRNLKQQSAETLFNALSTKDMATVQRQLAKEYNLTPKQVKTAVTATGVISSTQDAQRLIDKLKAVPKTIDVNITTHIRHPNGDPDMIGGRVGAGYGGGGGVPAPGFGDFAGAIFGATGDQDAPLTAASLLAISESEFQKAKKAEAAIAKLTEMGYAGLVQQFQSQGASGIEALTALAQGTPEQIAALNAQSAATMASYAASGLGGIVTPGAGFNPATQFQSPFGGHGPRGGGGGKGDGGKHDKELLDVLSKIDGKLEGDTGKTVLKGSDLLIMFRRMERQLGKQLLVSQ